MEDFKTIKGYKSSATMRLHLTRTLLDTWKTVPELRLGQLISCVVKDKDLFYLHDEQFLKLLQTFNNEHLRN